MYFLERNLEDIIYYAPNELLNKNGLPISGFKKRQVNLDNYGIADIITLTRNKNEILVSIYELKQKTIDYKTFLQALRYATWTRCILEVNNKFKNFEIKYEIILIGRSIDEKEIGLINSLGLFPNFKVYLYNFYLNGLFFNKMEKLYWAKLGF